MQKKNDSTSVLEILSGPEKKSFFLLACLRVLANGLDVLGVAGFALLGALASGLSQGLGSTDLPSSLTWLDIQLNERLAIALASVIVFVFGLKSFFSWGLSLFSARKISEIETRVSSSFVRQQQSFQTPHSAFHFSDVQSLAMESAAGVRLFLNSALTATAEGTLLVAITGLIFVTNPIVGLAILAYIGVVVLILNLTFKSNLQRQSARQIQGHADALLHVADLWKVRQEAWLGGRESVLLNRFTNSRYEYARASSILLVLHSLPRYAIETSLVIGVFLFFSGVILFSDLSSQATTIGVVLAGGIRIVASLIPFQNALSQLRQGAAMSTGIVNNLKRERADFPRRQFVIAPEKTGEPQKLEVKNVSFTHEKQSLATLHDVAFTAEKGEMVAIVGPSGSGKTTLMEMIIGSKKPDKGQITIDGVACDKKIAENPGIVSFVPQHPQLISGGLKENIVLGEINDADIRKQEISSLKSVGLEYLLHRSSRESPGTDPLEDLSGGELQRLALVRALSSSPGLLLLDEPTSSLDTKSEKEITAILRKLKGKITTVVIAHRLSTIRDADKVVYLEHGQIIAQGNHQDVQAKVPGFGESAVDLGGGPVG